MQNIQLLYKQIKEQKYFFASGLFTPSSIHTNLGFKQNTRIRDAAAVIVILHFHNLFLKYYIQILTSYICQVEKKYDFFS